MEKAKRISCAVLILIGSLALMAGKGNGKGNGGGNGSGSGSTGDTVVDRGSLYGDLYVVLRDIDGVPILDSYGCVQPISATTGEPFQLYSNEAEDVFCELEPGTASDVINIEFGRLNMGRAPSHVREAAFDEVIEQINSATDIGIDPAGRLLLTTNGAHKTIDSPRENLALYVKLMTVGHWVTTDTTPIIRGKGSVSDNSSADGDGPWTKERPVLSDHAITQLEEIGLGNLGDAGNTTENLNSDDLLLAASLLAAAADKTGHLTVDSLVYVNSIFGINQVGTLPGEVQDKTYFDFTSFLYDREMVYTDRQDQGCGNGSVWTLVKQDNAGVYWKAECQNILTDVLLDPINDDMTNISGFVQAANDALQVIAFTHNFAVPEPM